MRATQLADFVYCEAGFPLSDLPHPVTGPEVAGRATHEKLAEVIGALARQRAHVGTRNRLAVEQNRLVTSSRLGLEGRPDVLVRGPRSVTIIDFKTKHSGPETQGAFGARVWDNHAAQVLAYGVAAEEEFEVPTRLFVIYAASKVVRTLHNLVASHPLDSPGQTLLRLAEGSGIEIVLDDANQIRLRSALARIHDLAGSGGAFRRNHVSLEKCYMCVHRSVCPEKLLGVPDSRYPAGPTNPGLLPGERAHYPKPGWGPGWQRRPPRWEAE